MGFTDTSAGAVFGWQWDFGDQSFGSGQNPVHAYSAPGFYSVSLTVGGPGGENTATRNDLVRILPADADVNKDGVIDLLDLVLVLKIITEQAVALESQPGSGLGGDGRVGMTEAIYILRYLYEGPGF